MTAPAFKKRPQLDYKALMRKINPRELNKDINEESLTMVEAPLFDKYASLACDVVAGGIAGDVVECGCWRGGFAIWMAMTMSDRRLRVFDSFELGYPSVADSAFSGGDASTKFATGFSAFETVSLTKVLANFKSLGLTREHGISFYKGFVKDTLCKPPKGAGIKKIAMLHIDVDTYSATQEVLHALYDKVSDGGYVIFDDWNIDDVVHGVTDFFNEIGVSFEVLESAVGHKTGSYIRK